MADGCETDAGYSIDTSGALSKDRWRAVDGPAPAVCLSVIDCGSWDIVCQTEWSERVRVL